MRTVLVMMYDNTIIRNLYGTRYTGRINKAARINLDGAAYLNCLLILTTAGRTFTTFIQEGKKFHLLFFLFRISKSSSSRFK